MASQQSSGPAAVAAPPGVHERKSSGLVRAAGKWDTLIYNIMFTSPGLAVGLLFLYQPSFYPGIDMYVSLAIGAGVGLATVMVFAMLSAAIPRSGADYAWVSRILHPALAVMTSVGFTLLWVIFAGYQGRLFATIGLTPLFRQLGVATESTALIDIGNWFSTDFGGFVAGSVAMVLIVGIFIRFGLGGWFRIQNVLFALGMLGLVVCALAIAFVSDSGFRDDINSAFAWMGSGDTVGDIEKSAAEAGYAPAGFDWRNTLLGMTWVYASFLFGISSTWIGSEVQRAQRVQLWAVPLASVFTMLWGFLFIFLFDRIQSIEFIGAVGFIGGGEAFGSTPTFGELSSYTVPLLLSLLIGIGFAIWPLVVLPNLLLNASRNLFAYSLDGLVPKRLSDVSLRFGSPVTNLLVVLALAIVTLCLYQFTTILVTLSTFLVFVFGFIVVSITAIVLPYRRPDVFAASPVRWRLAGVPVIALVGIVSLVYNAFFIWVFLNDPVSGISGNTRMIWTNVGLVLVGLVVYLAAKAYWRSRSYDLDANFKELPVE